MQTFRGSAAEWDALIARLPGAHLLQTWEWAQVKAKYGWQPMPLVWSGQPSSPPLAAAMVLKRVIPAGGFAKKMCLLYTPKGPLLDWSDAALRGRVLDDLQALAKRAGAIFLKADPDVLLGTGVPGRAEAVETETGSRVQADLARRGWLFSQDQIQFRNTVLLDLAPSEAEILARMKQKTRYNLRLAEKKGVRVRPATPQDLPLLYKMYAETSLRDGFVIREEAYYRAVWEAFLRPPADPQPWAEALIAEVEGQPVAGLFLFYFAGRAYYLYGMSREIHREKMPNYLLQWEAIRRAKAHGCAVYDLWGAPDEFDERDSMWGVFRFKEGLGGQVTRTLGAWDYPASPLLYRMYTQVIPRLLDVMRWRGQRKTRQIIA